MDRFDDVVRVVAREDEAAVVLELFDERTERFLGVLGEVVGFVEEDDFVTSSETGATGELGDCCPNFANATIKRSVDEKEVSTDVATKSTSETSFSTACWPCENKVWELSIINIV